MDDRISPDELNELRGAFPPALVIDVRRAPAYDAANHAIAGALRRTPDDVADWANELEIGRRIVVYCIHGHEASQQMVGALRRHGFAAAYLLGGIEAWQARALPLAPKPSVAPTLWVTRERPKIDRIACPWLIRRFIDPDARFLYVPAGDVLTTARSTGAVPYDIPGVEFSHNGERCSFDAIVRRYGLDDPPLAALADIVRGADTSRLELTAQSAGLFAISLGLSAVFSDDQRMLLHGLVVYDALYAWCRTLRGETHNWPPVMPASSRAAQ
jgi:rhodanese-related sulfurtransferase